MSKNYRNYSKPSVEDVAPVEEPVNVENSVPNVRGTVVGCAKLNVRVAPRSDADVVCVIDKNTEVVVDTDESTDGFYKVFLSSGIEGFCMKEFIEIKP